jgi:hypothetical protein
MRLQSSVRNCFRICRLLKENAEAFARIATAVEAEPEKG